MWDDAVTDDELAALTADRDRLAAENERLELEKSISMITAGGQANAAAITAVLAVRLGCQVNDLTAENEALQAVIAAVESHHDAVHRHDRTVRGACGLCRALDSGSTAPTTDETSCNLHGAPDPDDSAGWIDRTNLDYNQQRNPLAPHILWKQAARETEHLGRSDLVDRYRELMIEHGHLILRAPTTAGEAT